MRTALVLALIASLALILSPTWGAAPSPEIAQSVLKALGDDWRVIESPGDEPNIQLYSQPGYRTVLYREVETCEPAMQQQREPPVQTLTPTRKTALYFDFTLFPIEQNAPEGIPHRPAWVEPPPDVCTVDPPAGHVGVYAGQGKGYDWFITATICDQEIVREKLGLKGGDDRVKLLIYGMSKDLGTHRFCSDISLLAKHGDRAVPQIVEAINGKSEVSLPRLFGTLGSMQGKESMKAIREFYGSSDVELSSMARQTLFYRPFRTEAKDLYFDMLRKRQDIHQCLDVCMEFDWKDAVPLIAAIEATPPDWRTFSAAFTAERVLKGLPSPKDLQTAMDVVRSTAYDQKPDAGSVEKAKSRILHFKDRQSVVVALIDLALYVTKGDTEPVNRAAVDMLKKLPENQVRPFLDILRTDRTAYMTERITELLAKLSG